jgi:archaellum component FlaC
MHGIDPQPRFEEMVMNQFAAIHNSFLGLQSQLTGLHTQVSGLERRLSGVERRISGVESELITFRSEVNAKFDRMHENMQAANNRALAWSVFSSS